MSDSIPFPATSPSVGRWAEVRAAEHVTRYFRRGAGAPVVMLGALEDAGHIWPDLVESLPLRFRVFFPESPATNGDFASWLLTFLDGLGLPPVALVAAGPSCVAALELAKLGPDQLERVVLIPPTQHEADALTAVVGGAGDVPVPVLVLGRECLAGEALERVSRFVTGETA